VLTYLLTLLHSVRYFRLQNFRVGLIVPTDWFRKKLKLKEIKSDSEKYFYNLNHDCRRWAPAAVMTCHVVDGRVPAILQSFSHWQQHADQHHQYCIQRTQQLWIVSPAYQKRTSAVSSVYLQYIGYNIRVDIIFVPVISNDLATSLLMSSLCLSCTTFDLLKFQPVSSDF